MLGFLLSVVGVLVVAVLLFLGASVLMGRGETQPPGDLDRSPVELPEDRPVTGDDVRALRLSVAVRGYRMTEVDWLLEQFADALEERDAEIASLRALLTEQQGRAATPSVAPDPAPPDDASTPETGDHEHEERSGA